MLNGIFDQANYAATKQMLDATMLRQEAIASNLANVETPNYKRVDLEPSFPTALSRAVQTGDFSSIANLKPSLAPDRAATSTNSDGNNVELEREMLALQQNKLSHALECHLISANLLKLRTAITGRTGG